MKAWHYDATKAQPSLVLQEVPEPVPSAGEVKIKVVATAATPTELSWYPTTHTRSGSVRQLAIPGHEFSGVVTEVAAGVNLPIGQQVFGMNDWYAEGATAEYCCATASSIAPKPPSLTHLEAASIPISALTAWQGLFDHAKLQAGERVLIHGGAGAVGLFAVQLAKWRGAEVVATASAANREVLQSLGAAQVIDYRTQRFDDLLTNIDVVFDTVGGDTLKRSWNVLSPSGRLVTIATSSETEQSPREKESFFIVEPNRTQLLEVTRLIEDGVSRPFVGTVVPFVRANDAFHQDGPARTGVGKVIIEVSTVP